MYRFQCLLSPACALSLLICAGTGELLAQEATVLRDSTELVLVAHGKSLTPIILPTKPTRFTKIAAADLADYIEKVGGERPKILKGLPNPIPKHAIWVGFQPVLKELFPGTDFELKNPEEILLKCDGKHLAIVGRDVWDPLTNKMKIVGGKTEAERKDYLAGFAEANGDVEGFQYEYGTVNAVYTFLQDKLGIRWLWPGADGEVVPQQSQVTLGPFELRYYPKIRMRQTVYAQLAIYKKGGRRARVVETGFADNVFNSTRCMLPAEAMALPNGMRPITKPIQSTSPCNRMAPGNTKASRGMPNCARRIPPSANSG